MTKFGPNIVWTLSSLFGLLVWANPPDSFEGVWWADCRREQHADLSYGTSRAYFCSGWSSISTSPMWSNSSAKLKAVSGRKCKGTNIALFSSAPANGMWYRTAAVPPIQTLIVKFQRDSLQTVGRRLIRTGFLTWLSTEDGSSDVRYGLCIPGVMWDYQTLKPPECSLVAQRAADADSRISCLCSRWVWLLITGLEIRRWSRRNWWWLWNNTNSIWASVLPPTAQQTS